MKSLLVFQYSNCIFAESVNTLHVDTFLLAVLHPGMEVDKCYLHIGKLSVLTFLMSTNSTVEKEAAIQALNSLC